VSDNRTFARLVERARDPSTSLHDQHAAFGEIVRRSQHIVYGLALASLRNAEDAKDAAQDAFVVAWHRIGQLRDPSLLVPWLRAIVARACARQRRQRREAQDQEALDSAVQPTDGSSDYQSVIASALQRLPPGERTSPCCSTSSATRRRRLEGCYTSSRVPSASGCTRRDFAFVEACRGRYVPISSGLRRRRNFSNG
jgi:hypothetical protein